MRTDYLDSIGQFTMQKLHLLNFVRHCNANTHSKTYTQSYTIRFDLFSLENDKEYCANVICVCVDVSFGNLTPPFLVFRTICVCLCVVYHNLAGGPYTVKKKLKITHAQLAKARKTNYVTQKKVTCTQHTQPKLLRLKYVQLTPDGQNVGSINATLTHRLELTPTHLYT